MARRNGFPSRRDRQFESPFLQQPVCLSSEPWGYRRKAPHFGGGLRVAGDVRRDVQAANRGPFALSLWRALVQSHLPKVLTDCKCDRVGAAVWGTSVRSCGLACEQFVLLRPVQRQIEFGQPRRGELDGLPTLQDRLDQLRAQEGEANETPNIAPGNTVTLGQLLERSGAAGGELLKPTRARAQSP